MWMNDIAVSLTNHCSASCVSCQRVTARICCCVSCGGATAAERRAAIDRHLLPAWRSPANPQQLTSGVPRAKDGQTDTQTDSNRSTFPASLALTSKPAAAACRGRRTHRQTHGQTDGQTPERHIDPAPHTMRAVSMGNESVPIQLAQCWFPRLAISTGKNIDRRPISQTKYTEAILSNSTRKLIWLEIAKMMIAV